MSNYTSELNDILNLSEHTDAENINNYFTFDSRSRKITIPASFVTLGVESDDSSERVWFEGPRIVGDNVDLTTRNIYINYQNANGEKDKYYVEDIVAEDDIVHFSWKVERKVVAYKGNVTFLICALTTDAEGKVETEWHTSRCTALVLEGLEVENPAPPAEEYDLINQLIDVTKKSIKDVTDTCAQTIEELGTKEQEAINNIAKKETSSIDAVEKAKNDAVDYIGNGLDSTLTKQGIAAESQAVGDAILKARIVDKSSGELISLSDSAEQPLQSMKIFGKTEQFTTTGKNLFDVSKLVEKNSQTAGSLTINDDGSITVTSGTSTNSVNSGATLAEVCPSLVAGKTYTLSAETDSTKGYIYLRGTKNSWYFGKSKVIDEADLAETFLLYPSDYSTTVIISKIQVVAGESELPYEPYTGGIPSPNPDYPQELVSVGDSGSTTEYVMGGNLFDGALEMGGIDGNTGNNLTATTYKRTINYIPVKPNTTYTISRECTTDNINTRFYDKDKKYIEYGFSAKVSPMTFTTKDNYYYLRLQLIGDRGNLTEKVQIVLGSTEKPYEPYKEQSLTIQTPNGLPGVPVSSGGNYTDSNGQQYVCDYKDHERNVYVQRVVKTVLDGSDDEPWANSNAVGTNKRYFMITIGELYYAIDNACLCTHYKQTSIGSSSDVIGINVFNSVAYNRSQISVRPNNYIDMTITAFRKLLAENPITVYYALTTPIETPLTEEEIQAYKALHTNYPNTTIYNSDGAGAEVEYVADTKNYVDNKIDKAIKNILEVVSNDG